VFEALIKEGCDVIAPTELAWVFPIARDASSPSRKIFAFGTRESWQPWSDIMVVGPWENWSDLYEKVLLDVRGGKWRPTELSWSLKEGALRLGGMGEPFNPDILPLLRAVRVKTLDVGELALPDLVQKRAEQMKYEAFEPFTGPVKDQKGKIRVQNGSRLRSRYLDYSIPATMDWLVDNVRGSIGRP
jgi:basic membrane protein A